MMQVESKARLKFFWSSVLKLSFVVAMAMLVGSMFRRVVILKSTEQFPARSYEESSAMLGGVAGRCRSNISGV